MQKIILSTKRPDLLSEWDYEKNQDTCCPDQVGVSSRIKVWWKCSVCGNEWQATIAHRTAKNPTGCPACSNIKKGKSKSTPIRGVDDLETLYPDIAKTWNYDKNHPLLPSEVKAHAKRKVWWKCSKGHEWQATIYNRVNGRGCPFCSSSMKTSLPEQTILYYLSKNLEVESRAVINKNEVDVYIPQYCIGIEYDGSYYHSKEHKQEKENRKNQELAKCGIDLIRIKPNKDRQEIDGNNIYIIERNYLELDNMINMLCTLLSNKIGITILLDVNFKRDRIKILNNYEHMLLKDSLARKRPDIAKEWNYDKNKNLIPESFSCGSGEVVWWKCNNGHEWKAAIKNRTFNNRDCPYCSNQKVLKGYNDLESKRADLVLDWDWEKNKQLPSEVLYSSSKKVFWKCHVCGTTWANTVNNRNRGSGCPTCGRKKAANSKSTPRIGKDDLKTQYPELCKEWNYDKNSNLLPEQTNPGSPKKVWWKCEKGHEWQAQVRMRVRGNGCPYCKNKKVLIGFNDIATTNPELSKEWDYEKNTNTPQNYVSGSNEIVWWRCSVCGFEWKTSINHRTHGRGCPNCARHKNPT